MNEHKAEIIETRKGCLGSSDGNLIRSVAQLGKVPKSAYKRLAELKGLIPHQDIPQTAAVKAGDFIEDAIYQHLKANDERYQTNPKLVSKKLSRKNVTLISHVDFMLKDDDKKVVDIYECKATKYDFTQTRDTYISQLFIHWMLGSEYVSELGKGWKLRLFLCHYSTDGLDLENDGIEFDPERLTVKQVKLPKYLFDIRTAMDVIDDFLESFDEYYEGDVIDGSLLPQNVREQFDAITTIIAEIKERDAKVEEFKAKLYEFMVEKDIKSINCDAFTISRVDPTVSKSFDGKRFINEMKEQHPIKGRRLEEQYTKTVNKKGYASIKIKNK